MLNIPLRAASIALGCTLAWSAAAQQPAPPPGAATPPADPVIARVGTAEVHLSDLRAVRDRLPEQYSQMPMDRLFEALRQQVVDTLLIASAAEKAGLDREPEVARQLDTARRTTLREVYVGRLIDDAVTDAAIAERYEALKTRLENEWQMRASHILVRSEEEANAVIRDLARPDADFAALARARSTGPSSSRGGDLGFFAPGDMVKPFSDAAMALEPGKVTQKPVRTQFGWHVIRLEERRRAPVPSIEEAQDRLRDEVAQAAVKSAVDKLRKETSVQRFDIDGSPERPSGIRLAPR